MLTAGIPVTDKTNAGQTDLTAAAAAIITV